jgi:hypothetical protein
MQKSLRTVVLGIAGTLAMACLAQPAAALTVSPTGVYSHVSASTHIWTFTTTGQAFTCTASSGSLTVAANGSGSSAAGNALFGGCTSGIWGPATITQLKTWPMQVQQTPNGGGVKVSLAFTVPTAGIKVVIAGCTLTLNGTIQLSRSFGSPLPATITSSDALSVTRSLTIDSAVGCSPLIASVGQGLTGTGTSSISRNMTISS